MVLNYLIGILFYFFMLFTPQELSTLQIIVTYDPDGDGVPQGVGSGKAVWVGDIDSEIVGYTDDSSSAWFLVESDKGYFIRAEVPPTKFLFVWVCAGFYLVDRPHKIVNLECVERFFFRIPWAIVPPSTE